MVVIAVVSASAVLAPARADGSVWMVKPSGGMGCSTREALETALRSPVPSPDASVQNAGCVALSEGERVLDRSDIGVGFDRFLKAQRYNGKIIYVPLSVLTPDTGTGSLSEDRQD